MMLCKELKLNLCLFLFSSFMTGIMLISGLYEKKLSLIRNDNPIILTEAEMRSIHGSSSSCSRACIEVEGSKCADGGGKCYCLFHATPGEWCELVAVLKCESPVSHLGCKGPKTTQTCVETNGNFCCSRISTCQMKKEPFHCQPVGGSCVGTPVMLYTDENNRTMCS